MIMTKTGRIRQWFKRLLRRHDQVDLADITWPEANLNHIDGAYIYPVAGDTEEEAWFVVGHWVPGKGEQHGEDNTDNRRAGFP